MQAQAASTTDSVTSTGSVTKLVPGASQSLAHLSDNELLASTRQLVGKSNQVFAALLVHLAEVEARGTYRTRACSSLYTYCIYELRFSEDAAARRAGAAKLVKRFPALREAVANGELHLTGLLMLGPHLTPENHLDVLARAKFRTKLEIAKLVRILAPLPQVPDRIEPLGPEAVRRPRNPTWQEFVQSLCPAVRELAPGERPRDWANDSIEPAETERGDTERGDTERGDTEGRDPAHALPAAVDQQGDHGLTHAPARCEDRELPPLTAAQLYQVQFTTTEEHVQLVERAKALLARQPSSGGLGELHLQAMRMLVAALEKQKFAVTARPRKPSSTPKNAVVRPQAPSSARAEASPNEQAVTESQSRQGVRGESEVAGHTRQRGGHIPAAESTTHTRQRGGHVPAAESTARRRGRYIPAAERRAVFERDAGRCSYVDERGQRCPETHGLEIHHLKAFAKGGGHELSNLALRCSPHNALAAEQDFGREHIVQKRNSRRHESLMRSD